MYWSEVSPPIHWSRDSTNHVRRFSETEQIAVLSFIILHYNITVIEEPQYAHETAEERKSRVLAPHARPLVQPIRTPVVFTPREGANILAY